MKNGNSSAMPLFCEFQNGHVEVHTGLTKREYFAGLAMQGMLASDASFDNAQQAASEAAKCADALLAELEKSQ